MLIAKCLLNSSMVTSLAAGEQIVQAVFDEYFEGQDFTKWNTQVVDGIAQSIIAGVGRAKCLDVRQFIADFMPQPDQGSESQSPLHTTERSAQPHSEPVREANAGVMSNGRT